MGGYAFTGAIRGCKMQNAKRRTVEPLTTSLFKLRSTGRRLVFFLIGLSVLCGSCNMIGIMGSKSYYEQKIPAELKLKDYARGGVLVFVDETGPGRGEHTLRPQLTDVVGTYLVKKARIKSENLLSSNRLWRLRGEREDFSLLSPVELGRTTGAAVVLYILITDYELYAMDEQGYYGGSLVTRSMLFDVSSGRALWPTEKAGRVVEVGVEIETGGREATLDRLITATAQCITRSFYDCPRPQFRSADEKRDYGSEQW